MPAKWHNPDLIDNGTKRLTKIFHEAEVLAKRVLTPGMLRLTFGGEGLADFQSTGVGDEYVRLFFPNAETGRIHLPHIDENGRWSYPDGQKAVRYSTYTVRDYRSDLREIDVDFVVHEGGMASDWAQRCSAGDTVTINKPRGLYAPPDDIVWQLLVADATGLPALARLLEQTPEHVQTRAFIEVAEPSHELDLPYHPHASVTWLHGSGNGVAASRVGDVVRALPLPPTPGYIWVAGEQRVVRNLRRYIRHDLRMPAERYELVGYWTEDAQAWEERYDALPEAVRAAIAAGWDSGRDREVVRDEYYATLERFGL